MTFHRNFLKHGNGEAGGKNAARWIKIAILDRAPPFFPKNPKIVVRIVADVTALAEACVKNIFVESGPVKDFVRAFNDVDPDIRFFDVGPAKDATDGKMTGPDDIVLQCLRMLLEFSLKQCDCRHVIFGGGQNDGYASMLKAYPNDMQGNPQIMILEGPQPQMTIPGMFHNQNIPFSHTASPKRLVRAGMLVPNVMSSVSAPTANTPRIVLNSLANLNRDSALTSTPKTKGETWAKDKSANKIQRNEKGQRIDPKLEYEHSKVKSISQKKSCNQHYIGGRCEAKPGKCSYSHDYKFDKSDLLVLRELARRTPCNVGRECDNPDCFHGHHCQFPLKSSGLCTIGENCRFPRGMHDVDTEARVITKITGH